MDMVGAMGTREILTSSRKASLNIFELRIKWQVTGSHIKVWGRGERSGKKDQCKCPEMGKCFMYSKIRK